MLVASKFARINVWNTFVLRVEHAYIIGKLEKSLDMGEPTFHAEKLQTKVHVFALVRQTPLKNYTKSTHKGCSIWNQMITSSNCT